MNIGGRNPQPQLKYSGCGCRCSGSLFVVNIQAGDRTKFHFEASTVVRSGYGGQPRPGTETTVSHTNPDRVVSKRVQAYTRGRLHRWTALPYRVTVGGRQIHVTSRCSREQCG